MILKLIRVHMTTPNVKSFLGMHLRGGPSCDTNSEHRARATRQGNSNFCHFLAGKSEKSKIHFLLAKKLFLSKKEISNVFFLLFLQIVELIACELCVHKIVFFVRI